MIDNFKSQIFCYGLRGCYGLPIQTCSRSCRPRRWGADRILWLRLHLLRQATQMAHLDRLVLFLLFSSCSLWRSLREEEWRYWRRPFPKGPVIINQLDTGHSWWTSKLNVNSPNLSIVQTQARTNPNRGEVLSNVWPAPCKQPLVPVHTCSMTKLVYRNVGLPFFETPGHILADISGPLHCSSYTTQNVFLQKKRDRKKCH